MSPVTLMDRSRHVRRLVGACVCRSFVDRWIDRLAMLRAYTSKGSDPELELHDSSVPAPTNEVVGMRWVWPSQSKTDRSMFAPNNSKTTFRLTLRQVWKLRRRTLHTAHRSLARRTNARERASEWHTLIFDSATFVAMDGAPLNWEMAAAGPPAQPLAASSTNQSTIPTPSSKKQQPDSRAAASTTTSRQQPAGSATPRGQPAGPMTPRPFASTTPRASPDDLMTPRSAVAATQNNRATVLAAVARDGRALEYASDELKNDREIVLAAVKQTHGRALEHASDELRNDRSFMLKAIEMDATCFKYATEDQRSDRELVLAAVSQLGFMLAYAPEHLRLDPIVVMAARKQKVSADGMMRWIYLGESKPEIGKMVDNKGLAKALAKRCDALINRKNGTTADISWPPKMPMVFTKKEFEKFKMKEKTLQIDAFIWVKLEKPADDVKGVDDFADYPEGAYFGPAEVADAEGRFRGWTPVSAGRYLAESANGFVEKVVEPKIKSLARSSRAPAGIPESSPRAHASDQAQLSLGASHATGTRSLA